MNIKENILIVREERMNLIRETFNQNNLFIISIKCNVCGDNKNFDYFEFVKKYFLNLILNTFHIQSYDYYKSNDGNYYLVQIKDSDQIQVKSKLVELEEGLLGRVVDLDLYTNLEKSITRSDLGLGSRKCIVCNDDTITCMKEKRHSVEEVLDATKTSIQNDLITLVVNSVTNAMINEVSAHPKFGLVTKTSSGKHQDMDYNTFITSINALKPYFNEYAMQGFDIDENTFTKLREIGIRAESAMFEETNHVNTHKGSIFILGFVIPSVINAVYNNKPFEEIKSIISFLAKDIMLDFNHQTKSKTIGEEAYARYKISGVRGEVTEGLVKVFNGVREFENYNGDINSKVIDLLIYFMSQLNDTVILHHQDIGFLDYVKSIGKEIIDAGGCMCEDGKELVELYTNEFIELNISPGGSADMVIATLAMLEIKKMYY